MQCLSTGSVAGESFLLTVRNTFTVNENLTPKSEKSGKVNFSNRVWKKNSTCFSKQVIIWMIYYILQAAEKAGYLIALAHLGNKQAS